MLSATPNAVSRSADRGPAPRAGLPGTISARSKQGQGRALHAVRLRDRGYAKDAASPKLAGMKIIVSSNDPVRLSFLTALLQDAGIGCVLLDSHVSAVEGSIGAIPRRLAVAEDDAAQALRVLREAGEA
jgi:hypothetical protein